MPIYEYRCSACDREFEELVRTEGQKVRCPSCGSAKIIRRMSVFGAVVAGGASGESCDACPGRDSCEEGSCDEGSCGGACGLGDD